MRKNYYYAGTIFLIVLTCVCYFAFDEKFRLIAEKTPQWNFLLKAFRHSGGLHLFGNMISLLWLGLFFENKIGSLGFVALFFAFIFIGNGACALYYNYSWAHTFKEATPTWFIFEGVGSSSANYALSGFIIMAAVFNYKQYFVSDKNAKLNKIWFCLIIAFFPVLMLFTGVLNPGHIYPLIIGLLLGVLFYLVVFLARKHYNSKHKGENH